MQIHPLVSPAGGTRRLALVTRCALVALILAKAGCNDSVTPTSPSTTTTTTTTTAATAASETFAGTLAVGTSRFYSFAIEQTGTLSITLNRVAGANVPSTIWMGLGLGTPSGEDCTTSVALNTQSGTAPQISGSYSAGTYCAKIWDIGNLVAPAVFDITIEHP